MRILAYFLLYVNKLCFFSRQTHENLVVVVVVPSPLAGEGRVRGCLSSINIFHAFVVRAKRGRFTSQELFVILINMHKLFIFFILLAFSSCAVLDAPKRIAGYSTEKFEKEQTGRHSAAFDLTKKESFDRTLSTIKHLRARVTSKSFNKGYITAFDFAKSFDYCLDSTEAAFFIEEISEKQVKITVVCNNSLLAQNLSEKFFDLMLNPPKTQEEELF